MQNTYQELQEFATQEQLKIENQKLIFDHTTTNLKFVDIGQYEKGKYSPFDGLFKAKITQVTFIEEQPNLQYLDLSYQPLKKITLKNCPNLQKLYLFNCDLEEIVFEGSFPKLELIDLSKNKLTKVELPKQNFPALQNFFINGNKIEDISFLAPFIVADEDFDFGISKNPLIANFEGKDNDWIRDFYRQQSKYGKELFYEAKIIIVGEGESGKTTFRRLLFDRTTPVPDTTENQPSTHGIAVQQNKKFKHLHKENTEITCNIWDFGGQDIQYNLHHYFLSPDALYILVTDLRSEKTRFTYWFQAINFFGSENIPLIILKNEGKQDGSNDINIEQYKRDFPTLAKNINEVRINLSQINEKHKIDWDNLLEYLIPQQLEKLKTVGVEGVKIWSEIRHKFTKYKTPYVKFDDLFDFAEKNGMDSEKDFVFMLNYFHHSGIIVYYAKDNDLNNYVFVKPNWITENLYSAITEKGIAENGVFEQKKLFDFWKSKGINSREDRTILLQLMQKEKFDVAYSLGNEKYAVPILFPDKEKQYKAFGDDILQFKYEFKSFLPKGLFSRFTVRMYENIEHNEKGEDLAWKTGLVLHKNGTRAIIIEHTDNKISIKIEGSDKISLRSVIIDTFEKLFEKYPQKPDLLIPCNCETCKNASEPEFFTYTELLDYVNTNDKIQCRASRKMIDPSKLLHGIKMFGEGKGGEKVVVNVKVNETKINGDGNTTIQDVKAEKIEISKGSTNKDEFEKLHKHLNEQDESLSQIKQLQTITNQEIEKLSDFQNFISEKIISEIEKNRETFFENQDEEKDFRRFVSGYIEDLENKEEAQKLKQMINNERIDVSSKLKFAIPFIIGKYEIEFSTKNQMPQSWKDLKALFLKRKKTE